MKNAIHELDANTHTKGGGVWALTSDAHTGIRCAGTIARILFMQLRAADSPDGFPRWCSMYKHCGLCQM